MGYNTVCLGDVVNFYSGGTPSKKNPDYWDGDIPWVSAKAMDADGVNNNVLHISEDGLAAGSRLADTGSILFLTRGSGLFTRIPVIWVYSPVAYNQDIKCLKAKNQNDARYIYHWLTSQRSIFTKSLDVTGIGAGKINTDQLQRMQLFWPSEAERQRIVLLADPLIAAVHLNKRTNGYLSDMLDALFDRVISEESCDWEVASLLDIASYKNGLAMQRFRPVGDDPGLPVLKIRELGQGYCGADAERCRSDIDEAVAIHDGDLIFSWSGTLLLDFWAGGDAGLNQHLFKVTSDAYPSWFYYMWTKRHMKRFVSLAKDRATTMGHIKRSALQESEVLIPPSDRMGELTAQMQPIVDEMIGLKVQSRRLGELRDALLPKLMSGEVDVSQVAFYAGRATPSL